VVGVVERLRQQQVGATVGITVIAANGLPVALLGESGPDDHRMLDEPGVKGQCQVRLARPISGLRVSRRLPDRAPPGV